MFRTLWYKIGMILTIVTCLNRLKADIDPAFKEEILDVPQAQREPDI